MNTMRMIDYLPFFEQTSIVSHDQVAVDLLDKIEDHADGDEQARTTVEAGDAGADTDHGSNDGWQDGNDS
jgi:hypothetical protein